MMADIAQVLSAGDIRQFFDLRDARQLDRTKARSTPAFDLTFSLVTLLAISRLVAGHLVACHLRRRPIDLQ